MQILITSKIQIDFFLTVFSWFTFPELLMPLWMQKKTAIHAINNEVAKGKRISPGSSMPFETFNIRRLKRP